MSITFEAKDRSIAEKFFSRAIPKECAYTVASEVASPGVV